MPEPYSCEGRLTARRTAYTDERVATLTRVIEQWEDHDIELSCQNSPNHIRIYIRVDGHADSGSVNDLRQALKAFENVCVVGARFAETWGDDSGGWYVGTSEQVEKRLSVYHFEQARTNITFMNPRHVRIMSDHLKAIARRERHLT